MREREVETMFHNIPSQEILQIAKDIQTRLEVNKTLEKQKDNSECDWVTEADIKIQNLLLDYFSNSSFKGKYLVEAEENMEKIEASRNKQWQILIDPLDGTNAFRVGKETWGVMVGLCNKKGILKYSWNIVSTGDTFQTENKVSPTRRASFEKKIEDSKSIKIDVYDYGDNISTRFGKIFENVFSFKQKQYTQSSYPSAVWTGWQLFQNNLDGLLWLPSDKGKQWYPDYDLIFLGSLPQLGFKIRLGKIEEENSIVVVAPTEKDVDKLYEVGLHLITKNQINRVNLSPNPLQITKPI